MSLSGEERPYLVGPLEVDADMVTVAVALHTLVDISTRIFLTTRRINLEYHESCSKGIAHLHTRFSFKGDDGHFQDHSFNRIRQLEIFSRG